MKRFFSIALSLVLLLCLSSPALTPAANAAAEIMMTAVPFAPILVGVITEEEWGERSCWLDPFLSSSNQPTVYSSGNGSKRPTRIEILLPLRCA